MTNPKDTNKKAQPVNPVLLVILGVVIVGGGIYYGAGYFNQPAPAVQLPSSVEPAVASQASPVPSPPTEPQPNSKDSVLPEQELSASQIPQASPAPSPLAETQPNGNSVLPQKEISASLADDSSGAPLAHRDPFEPSNFYTRSVSAKNNPAPVPNLITVPSVQKGSSGIEWEGVISAGNNDQVIIIRYKDNPYSLRLGDRLPGTQYIVGQVNQNSVLLMAPKGKLQLNRKKEVR